MNLLQLLQEVTLLLRGFLRYGDLQPRQDVSLPAAAQLRRAAAADAQQLPTLGAGGHLQRDGPFGSRHIDVRAERRVGVRHGHLDLEIGAATLVKRRSRHTSYDDQIAGLSAAIARLPLALEANLGPVLDARRDLDLVAARPTLAPRALAALARFFDHGPRAAAARALVREAEETLALDRDSTATAFRADDRRGPGLRA